MDSFNFLIVGSGPSGVAAARRLRGKGTCIVDVGQVTTHPFMHKSLREGLASGDIGALLGSKWEMLSNLVEPSHTHSKLRAPGMRHVTNGHPFTVYGPSGHVSLEGASSYAAGGMSNAWGAQLLRYTKEDLAEVGDWPIDVNSLDSYYSDLETYIGISGQADDMHDFLGDTSNLMPPTLIVPAAEHLLMRYKNQKRNKKLRLGRARLAVLTDEFCGYPPHSFNETEFFSSENPGIYTAKRTLDELRSEKSISYLGDSEVVSYKEFDDFVEVDLRNIKSDSTYTVKTKHLVLACGTLQTTRLVLLNEKAYGIKRPFIDHPPTLIPFFIPRTFKSSLPTNSFPVQLVGTLDSPVKRDMISFYYPGGLLWSDLIADMPLPANCAMKILPILLSGMLVAQIWEASKPMAGNFFTINENGEIRIDYLERSSYQGMKSLVTELSSLGAYSLTRLATMAPPGWGFHYAGCLPMKKKPGIFETNLDGRLWNSRRVRVVDGSVLPSLPAKNHSLTMMANAGRIADELSKCEY